MEKGLVQVYCGDGKGKTTAAIGQGIRAVGSGLKVIMIQFLKNDQSGEIKTLANLEPTFKTFHFEKSRPFFFQLDESQKEELKGEIRNAMNFAEKTFDTKECDMLILDEILGVVENNLLAEEELLEFIKRKPECIELVMTGRKLPEWLIESADYISRIRMEKHPYEKGIESRKGIEF